MPDQVLSHPYDPLLVLLLQDPDVFEIESFCDGRHRVVGNTPEKHGVPEPDNCR